MIVAHAWVRKERRDYTGEQIGVHWTRQVKEVPLTLATTVWCGRVHSAGFNYHALLYIYAPSGHHKLDYGIFASLEAAQAKLDAGIILRSGGTMAEAEANWKAWTKAKRTEAKAEHARRQPPAGEEG